MYRLIYADPPWKYRAVDVPVNRGHVAAEKEYEVMDISELAEFPVTDYAADDCALFCWMTVPLLPETLPLLEIWGFSYKTCLFWKKTGGAPPPGYWWRNEMEVLTVSTRGKIRPFRFVSGNVIEAKRTGHSRKPRIFYELLESTGLEPKIELFARERVEGWDVFGKEIPKTAQTRLRL